MNLSLALLSRNVTVTNTASICCLDSLGTIELFRTDANCGMRRHKLDLPQAKMKTSKTLECTLCNRNNLEFKLPSPLYSTVSNSSHLIGMSIVVCLGNHDYTYVYIFYDDKIYNTVFIA